MAAPIPALLGKNRPDPASCFGRGRWCPITGCTPVGDAASGVPFVHHLWMGENPSALAPAGCLANGLAGPEQRSPFQVGADRHLQLTQARVPVPHPPLLCRGGVDPRRPAWPVRRLRSTALDHLSPHRPELQHHHGRLERTLACRVDGPAPLAQSSRACSGTNPAEPMADRRGARASKARQKTLRLASEASPQTAESVAFSSYCSNHPAADVHAGPLPPVAVSPNDQHGPRRQWGGSGRDAGRSTWWLEPPVPETPSPRRPTASTEQNSAPGRRPERAT